LEFCGFAPKVTEINKGLFRMDFDDQLQRYFGTADLSSVRAEAMSAGIEHMRVDFGLETDRGHRFALWAVLYMLGAPLDLEAAFEDEADRNSARDFMDMMDRAQEA
jgi:hypothetical protein